MGQPEDRFPQFDAVARLLRQMMLQNPLLIVLDDTHWADRPSLVLLQHLSRTLTDEKLVMLINYRDTATTNAVLMSELLREPVSRQIHLSMFVCLLGGTVLIDLAHQWIEQRTKRSTQSSAGRLPGAAADLARTVADIDAVTVSGVLEVRD